MRKIVSLQWGMAGAVGLALAAGCASQGGNPFQAGRTPDASGLHASGGDRQGAWGSGQSGPLAAAAPHKVRDPGKLHLKYAQWQEREGNLAEAREKYERVLADDPRSADAVLGLARLDHLAGRTAQAEQGFARAMRLRPNDPQTLASTGQFYASQEKWDKAVDLLQQAAAAAPHQPAYRFELAVALARSGNTAAAMPHFVQTVGEAEAHYNVGHLFHEQGRLEDAERHLAEAAARKPDLAEAQEMLRRVRREKELLLADRPTSAGPQRSAGTRAAVPERRVPGHSTGPVQGAVPAHSPALPEHEQFVLPAQYPYPPSGEGGRVAAPAADSFLMPTVPEFPAPQASPQQREQWENQSR